MHGPERRARRRLSPHHRAATEGTVTGTATAIHLGRTLATTITITDDRQRLICTARLTCLIIDAPPEDRASTDRSAESRGRRGPGDSVVATGLAGQGWSAAGLAATRWLRLTVAVRPPAITADRDRSGTGAAVGRSCATSARSPSAASQRRSTVTEDERCVIRAASSRAKTGSRLASRDYRDRHLGGMTSVA
jgi:hypothetical protein